MQYLLGIMMFLTALFLILLVLIQRGRGGGLAGAFGGAGGQSAFGTKAGDMFTKITIGTAFFWIVIAAMSVRMLNAPKASVLGDGSGVPSIISPPTTPEDGGAGLLDGSLNGIRTEGGTEPAPSTEPNAKTGEQPEGDAAAPATDAASESAAPAAAAPASAAPATEAPASASPPATPPAADPAPSE